MSQPGRLVKLTGSDMNPDGTGHDSGGEATGHTCQDEIFLSAWFIRVTIRAGGRAS